MAKIEDDDRAKTDRVMRHIELDSAIVELSRTVDRAEALLHKITGGGDPEGCDKDKAVEPSLASMLAGGPTMIHDHCARLDKTLNEIENQIF